MGTVIVHSGDLSGGSSAVSDDDYNHNHDDDDDEGSGTMVIRDEVMLERLHSGDYDATAAPGANGDDAAASVIVHSSRSEVQPSSSSANSPRPWLNKYRSPETWVPHTRACGSVL
jgi:U3 small nucleolar RNA-associated protein 14